MKKLILAFMCICTICLGLIACAKEEPWKSDFLASLETETKEYDESETERQTESVRELPKMLYSLPWEGGEINDILAWGNDVLVVSLKNERLNLIRISVEDGHIITQRSLDVSYGLDVKVVDGNLRTYEYPTKTWTWYDNDLEVVDQYAFPESVDTWPYIDDSGKYVYYIDENYQFIRYDRFTDEKYMIDCGFEAENNIFLENLFNGGAIAAVSSYVEDLNGVGGYRMHFIDTQTQTVLYEKDGYLNVSGDDDYYYSLIYGKGRQLIYGRYDSGDAEEFIFKDYNAYDNVFVFPESSCVVTWTKTEGDQGLFSLYSMEEGTKTSECEFTMERDSWGVYRNPWDMVCLGEDKTIVYTLIGDNSRIYVWNPISSVSKDETDYSRVYLSWDAEDEAIHKQLRKRASDLGEQYGVFVYISDLCPTNYYGYVAERSFSARAMEHGLNIVEKALSAYPEGFFEQLSKNSRGKLKICLVDALYPAGADSLETTTALYNYDDSSQAIVLSLSAMSDIEDLFYHETSHAIDMKLYDANYQWYTDSEWDMLNPPGFFYDNSYVANAEAMNSAYVWGYDDKVYFIDSYSKSFPTEDRARLMEYAIGKYPEVDCFDSQYLLAKLSHRSAAIRAAFDTTGWPNVTSWERPLQ